METVDTLDAAYKLRPTLLRAARRRINDAEAEDATSEFYAYLVTANILSRFRPDLGYPLEFYIRAMFKKFLLGRLSKARTIKAGGRNPHVPYENTFNLSGLPDSSCKAPDVCCDMDYLKAVIPDVIESVKADLGEKYAKAVDLFAARHLSDLTFDEIAESFGLNSSSVRSQLVRHGQFVSNAMRKRICELFGDGPDTYQYLVSAMNTDHPFEAYEYGRKLPTSFGNE